jgi:hypothetical protein
MGTGGFSQGVKRQGREADKNGGGDRDMTVSASHVVGLWLYNLLM